MMGGGNGTVGDHPPIYLSDRGGWKKRNEERDSDDSSSGRGDAVGATGDLFDSCGDCIAC